MGGALQNGIWQSGWYDTSASGGAFKRTTTRYRNWITKDGSPGPSGSGGFAAQPGRYHLYVSLACPWAHRTLIFRSLKGLGDLIGVSVVHPDMLDDGWTFSADFPGSTGDQLYGLPFLRDIYTKSDAEASGRVTVPVLWDRERGCIVSNESAEIIRMFNSAFDELTGNRLNFLPEALIPEIDRLNAEIYDRINNGVYKAGFATTQAAYDAAIAPLFEQMDQLEARLSGQDWLAGEVLTEADWRLFTTLVRFDTVYHGHFKCNLRRLTDYPQLWDHTRALLAHPGIAETTDLRQIARHYYFSHDTINPTRIVPVGPVLDWSAPTRRRTEAAIARHG